MKYVLLFLSILSGCLPGSVIADSSFIEETISNESRSEKDRKLDPMRKPGEFLSWLDIGEGMAVLDVFGGGGYYAEILSKVVGDEGFVTLYNNGPWDEFVGEDVRTRLANDRLPNVDYLVELPFNLEMDEEYDAAIFVLGMHDLYYEDVENGWRKIDVETFLKAIHTALKDGAVLGVIDHNARPGTDPSIVGKELHRIDPAIIKHDLEAAGFTFIGESDILRNPGDRLSKLVFDPEIRWQTDRSVMKFRK